MFSYYEFFAGGGMARAGLGPAWNCLYANDFDYKKGETYKRNWGGGELHTGDVGKVQSSDLPGYAALAWASFPCQDLSLAGGGAGLKGERSGTFWPFWRLMSGLADEGRKPSVIVLENVCGTLSSHKGKDFAAICRSLRDAGYSYGAVVVDAARFVPQSRPRLFVIGVDRQLDLPESIVSTSYTNDWHTRALRLAYDRLPALTKRDWIWWRLPVPPPRQTTFADLIEDQPSDVSWHTPEETAQILSMMSETNLAKVQAAKKLRKRVVGGIYRRTRQDQEGVKLQRAEVRFDDVAGCLRTPAGGSSRQLIMVVEGNNIRTRLISSRETARLMGLPDSYQLPKNYNEAYHLTGDGVVVPVVRHLAQNIVEPIILCSAERTEKAA